MNFFLSLVLLMPHISLYICSEPHTILILSLFESFLLNDLNKRKKAFAVSPCSYYFQCLSFFRVDPYFCEASWPCAWETLHLAPQKCRQWIPPAFMCLQKHRFFFAFILDLHRGTQNSKLAGWLRILFHLLFIDIIFSEEFTVIFILFSKQNGFFPPWWPPLRFSFYGVVWTVLLQLALCRHLHVFYA